MDLFIDTPSFIKLSSILTNSCQKNQRAGTKPVKSTNYIKMIPKKQWHYTGHPAAENGQALHA
jgi:hypothetical protein